MTAMHMAPPMASIGGNDAFTSILIHADGSNGGTAFSDASKNVHSVGVNGTVTTSTTQTKFGATSASFSSGSLGIAANALFEMGSSDFAVDCWFRTTTTGALQTIMSRGISGISPLIMRVDNTNKLRAFINGGSDGDITGTTSISANTWYHAAYTRNGSNFKLFLNGAIEGTATSANAMGTTGTNLYWGGRSDGVDFWAGFLDEMRLTKGTARWTAAFTPYGAPYGS